MLKQLLVGAVITALVGGGADAEAFPMAAGERAVRAEAGAPAPSKVRKKKSKKKANKRAADQEQARGDVSDGVRAVWGKHPSIRYGSVFQVDLAATFMEDAHASDSRATELSRYDLHRNRVGVSGNVFKHIEFEVERELTTKAVEPGKLAKSPWKDALVNVSFVKNAQVQAGRFKIPFGLDELTGSSHNPFIYRSVGASSLSPGRDAGAMVHGRFLHRGLNYWAGVFDHDGDHSRSTHIAGADQTVAGRITGRPFRRFGANGVELGTAFAVSSLSDAASEPNGLRGQTVVTGDTFFRAVYVKGQRRRWETDLDWAAGPASVRAEYTWTTDDRLQQGLGNQNLPDVRARSWFVSGGWKLPVARKRAGTVELVGRVERMWFDSVKGQSADSPSRSPRAEQILPNGDRVLTVGVNWQVNRWIKLQVNAIREQVEDAERSPVSNGAPFWSKAVRLQLGI
ncbi:MAG: porin [Acidobacteriota bacterium]